MAGKVKIVKMNVDENPGVPGKMGIRSIPTLMLFKDGKLASAEGRRSPKGALVKWIEDAIASMKAPASRRKNRNFKWCARRRSRARRFLFLAFQRLMDSAMQDASKY